uniref:Uncharacterized protein n=1 Tax=Arundo donax TaxID=35708 RepID=A0A0A9B0Z5_ARUDO
MVSSFYLCRLQPSPQYDSQNMQPHRPIYAVTIPLHRSTEGTLFSFVQEYPVLDQSFDAGVII